MCLACNKLVLPYWRRARYRYQERSPLLESVATLRAELASSEEAARRELGAARADFAERSENARACYDALLAEKTAFAAALGRVEEEKKVGFRTTHSPLLARV